MLGGHVADQVLLVLGAVRAVGALEAGRLAALQRHVPQHVASPAVALAALRAGVPLLIWGKNKNTAVKILPATTTTTTTTTTTRGSTMKDRDRVG